MATFWKLFLVFLFICLIFYSSQTLVGDILQLIGALYVFAVIPWYSAKLIKSCLRRSYVSPRGRAVLISGCDSGIGLQTAKQLDSYGFHVFAGCLNPNGDGAGRLREECSSRLETLKLDITSEEDVEDAVKTIKSSGFSLWALVNNGGVRSGNFVEEGKSVQIFEKVFRVNVLGTIRLTKSCLPLIRQSKGRVVNLSSILARFLAKGHISYAVSKSALRCFTDGLRRDMEPFGVRVISVEPAGYRTPIADLDGFARDLENNWNQTDEEVKQSYGEQYKETILRQIRVFEKTFRDNLREVTDVIEEAVTADDPDTWYTCCGPMERPVFWLMRQLPDEILDFIYGDRFLNFVVDMVNEETVFKSKTN